MAAKGSVSKQKDPNARQRIFNGEIVKPVLYNGINAGHGKYLAGEVKGQLVTDSAGIPFPLREIGTLERIQSN